MTKWDELDDKIGFLDSLQERDTISTNHNPYKILIADDDHEVHRITKMVLSGFEFEGRSLTFISTFSGAETKEVLKDQQDIAVLFLDVVMESTHSGLEVVSYLREQLGNTLTRIILRTGQPGEAPEETVIRAYDINDYRLKTELTVKRLFTTLYGALRNYAELYRNKVYQQDLEKLIHASSHLFEHTDLSDFLNCMIKQIISFDQNLAPGANLQEPQANGVLLIKGQEGTMIAAGAGKFSHMVNLPVESVKDLLSVHHAIERDQIGRSPYTSHYIAELENGLLITNTKVTRHSNYIYIEGQYQVTHNPILKLFLSSFSMALDHYILKNVLHHSQKEIVYALANAIESNFIDSDGHIQRISSMMYRFSLELYHSFQEAELVKLASTMHDLGKMAIPEAILKKEGPLTQEEFEIVKHHVQVGYKILAASTLPVLKIAADIALNHHENFDGSGYPAGKSGMNIPLYARMMAIVDTYDAMTHHKVYKPALEVDKALYFIQSQSGWRYDPQLVKVFIEKITTITARD